ncbi:transcriptional regulator, TetR family [Ruminiclostridium papyrosolvens DSM 2782]|uniref:Transcriptional regulator, TetR family n=1 Tax=Ruminiclostridium papyrosolvens DSM 2782 TaxID=588581 RepID=F1TH93_9FIRM|nr:TetR/AcrR family transcriptional regulator [Ruminiclostridium papyrosolvens]EGD46333.1 transcriptional regulator, TetR family [Ruminiclostridium papyrosolvens DSM 2782]WES32948.1 TetR/AcrR family transcriptional regulator [Ruminiclostridium papyrosolvens DSM 2782]
MDKFLNLPEDKRKRIVDAALKSFGANGYKKTSVSDIAKAADISKAMVFHYFGTKKDLYLYLIRMCTDIIINEINSGFDSTVTDFFERIKQSSKLKASVMKKHNYIPAFLIGVYFESDPEVKSDITTLLAAGDDYRDKIAFEGMDTSKFKEGIDPKSVLKMLIWMAEGYFGQLPASILDIDAMLKEFYECMDLLRNNFYKEEYL